jgi:hypothetical protein
MVQLRLEADRNEQPRAMRVRSDAATVTMPPLACRQDMQLSTPHAAQTMRAMQQL